MDRLHFHLNDDNGDLGRKFKKLAQEALNEGTESVVGIYRYSPPGGKPEDELFVASPTPLNIVQLGDMYVERFLVELRRDPREMVVDGLSDERLGNIDIAGGIARDTMMLFHHQPIKRIRICEALMEAMTGVRPIPRCENSLGVEQFAVLLTGLKGQPDKKNLFVDLIMGWEEKMRHLFISIVVI